MENKAKQVGGDHYGDEKEYGHWDWVHDVGLDYHLGNASKYVCRYPRKNGLEDLLKAESYVAKKRELKGGLSIMAGALTTGGTIATIIAKTAALAKSQKLSHDQFTFCLAAAIGDNTLMVSSLSLMIAAEKEKKDGGNESDCTATGSKYGDGLRDGPGSVHGGEEGGAEENHRYTTCSSCGRPRRLYRQC